MAQARRPKDGQKTDAVLRRIGHHHVVVAPARMDQVLDMRLVDRDILKFTKQLASMARQRVQMEIALADLLAQRIAFDGLPIDRDEDDPDVPLEAPQAPVEDAKGDAKNVQPPPAES